MSQVVLKVFFTSLLFFGCSGDSFGWGEQGHDIITRVASRIITAKDEGTFQNTFQRREHMLAHLSNVPDIVWRADYQETKVQNLNSPTHFFQIDSLMPQCEYGKLPKSLHELQELASKKKTSLFVEVGTLPWRIQQFFTLMVSEFKRAKNVEDDKDKFIKHIDQALLHGGLLAHFIGDLANPLHTTEDFDGWATNQGGIHKYFESDLVDALLLSLVNEVYVYTLMKRPYHSEIASVMGEDIKDIKNFGLKTAFALGCNSFNRLGTIRKLDRKHAIKTRSRQIGISKVDAERQTASASKEHFRSIIVERLAIAADVLGEVWYQAWQEGGSPNLSKYRSYFYPVKPDFVEPNYLLESSNTPD